MGERVDGVGLVGVWHVGGCNCAGSGVGPGQGRARCSSRVCAQHLWCTSSRPALPGPTPAVVPEFCISCRRHATVAAYLLREGADPLACDWVHMRTCLHYAAMAGQADCLRLLCSANTQVRQGAESEPRLLTLRNSQGSAPPLVLLLACSLVPHVRLPSAAPPMCSYGRAVDAEPQGWILLLLLFLALPSVRVPALGSAPP